QATAVAYVGSEVWPISGGQFEDADYFHEIIGKPYEDPWFGSRAVGDNLADGVGPTAPMNAQCYPYSFSSTENSASNATYFFQWQSVNAYPWQRIVTFPSIKYDFWKKITSQSRGYKGLYYFANNGSNVYKKFNTGTGLNMVQWANVLGTYSLGPGVYFFDSLNNTNPQLLTGAAKAAVMAGGETWNSAAYNSSGGPSFLMEGFYYLNCSTYGTTGMGSSATTVQANFPGEPYRDIGYPRWSVSAGNWDSSCGGGTQICRDGAGDGIFSYQDLNNNGRFDVVTVLASTLPGYPANYYSYDPSATGHATNATWVIKTWKSNAQATIDYGAPCTVPAATYDGTNPLSTDCTEPSEPYLNIIYPTASTTSVTVGWEDPANQTYRPKILTGTSLTSPPVDCTVAATAHDPTQCTSNAFDLDGGIAPINVILDGVLYN
ncbi:MAG TPA: hypothetical protein VKT80_10250, partial [Chloroflexota bacterium]|nr:hypothetical protein [Chloroflexota bacterium]